MIGGMSPIAIGVIISAIVGFIYLQRAKSGAGKTPKEFRTEILLFTRRNEVYRQTVENRGGLMLPAIGPFGFVENQLSVIAARQGRIWRKYPSAAQVETARRRFTVYVVRENDPTPLTLGAGFHVGYQPSQVDTQTLSDLEDLNTRAAGAIARQEGSHKDAFQSRMALAAVFAVIGTAAIWGAIIAVGLLKGIDVF
jgi:hypothetical protein